jgi:hypothetical protein
MRSLLTATIGLLLAFLLWPSLWRDVSGVRAGTAVRLELPELVQHSDLILEGRVLAARTFESRHGIETEYLLEVARTFEGQDQPHRAIRIPGGVLPDGRALLLSGLPKISTGEDVLLFLSRESATGVRMPVGLAQGKYRVVTRRDGSRVLVRNAAGVALVNPQSGALTTPRARLVREYVDMVAEIEAALALKHSR